MRSQHQDCFCCASAAPEIGGAWGYILSLSHHFIKQILFIYLFIQIFILHLSWRKALQARATLQALFSPNLICWWYLQCQLREWMGPSLIQPFPPQAIPQWLQLRRSLPPQKQCITISVLFCTIQTFWNTGHNSDFLVSQRIPLTWKRCRRG